MQIYERVEANLEEVLLANEIKLDNFIKVALWIYKLIYIL